MLVKYPTAFLKLSSRNSRRAALVSRTNPMAPRPAGTGAGAGASACAAPAAPGSSAVRGCCVAAAVALAASAWGRVVAEGGGGELACAAGRPSRRRQAAACGGSSGRGAGRLGRCMLPCWCGKGLQRGATPGAPTVRPDWAATAGAGGGGGAGAAGSGQSTRAQVGIELLRKGGRGRAGGGPLGGGRDWGRAGPSHFFTAHRPRRAAAGEGDGLGQCRGKFFLWGSGLAPAALSP